MEEALHDAPGGLFYAQSLSCALIARLVKNYSARKPAKHTGGSLSDNKKRRIIDFIEAHIGNELSITLLAQEVGLSPHHFSHCFAASFGLSPHRYVLQRRMEKALRMLTMSSQPIVDIAMELGFSSQSHFTQIFRLHTGMTPMRAGVSYID